MAITLAASGSRTDHFTLCAHGFLKEGANSLIVFETEGRYQETLQLVQQPYIKEVKGENL